MPSPRGHRIVLVGLFSAKTPDPATELAQLGQRMECEGGTVVGQVIQRRGVSRSKGPGGAQRLDAPLSAATVIGTGKVREVAALCAEVGATLVVFHNPLSERQRTNLEAEFNVPVVSAG